MHADIRGRVGMLHNAASLGSRLLDEHRHIGHQQDLKSLPSSHLSDIGKIVQYHLILHAGSSTSPFINMT